MIKNANALDPEMIEKFRDPSSGSEQLKSITLFKAFDKELLRDIYKLGEVQSIQKACHAVIEGEPSRGSIPNSARKPLCLQKRP